MICASAKNVAAPFAQDQLYWLALGAARADRFNPASFFFASPDGSTLQPALLDMPRFITALSDVIHCFPSAPFSVGLQDLLAKLTADITPPAPVYPCVGDTAIKGKVLWVVSFQSWKAIPGQQPPWPLFTVWAGHVVADIEANDYSTPPANSDIPFIFQFSSLASLCPGQRVTFDLAQGKGAAYATNVQPA